MEPTYVALDLETTGLNAERDAIIEVAAVRFSGDHVLGKFETFVQSSVDLPLRVQQITGLSPADLVGAPEVDEVIPQLLAFIDGSPLVGHSIGQDLRFLTRHGAALNQAALDTFELASILVPEATRYGLGDLADLLGLDVPEEGRHRALADAHAHRLLFLALCERARCLPPHVREAINRLAGRVDWALGVVFEDRPSPPCPPLPNGTGEGGATAGSSRESTGPAVAIPPSPVPFGRGGQGGEGGALDALLAPGGPLAERLPGFEDRPGQREMLRAVAEAFDGGGHLLIEAGTGIGKSLAYLVPAAAWALARERPMVVSTHTLTLQDQLMRQDLPLVAALVGGDLRACVLKGRANYLCRARLAGLAGREDLDAETVSAAAKILVWAETTITGDRSELLLFGNDERAWRLVCAEADACTPERCPYARAGSCWAQRARARAEAAHVIIVNHALLIQDALAEHRILPRYAHLVIDEAHHLEAVATDALGEAITQARARDAALGLAGPRGLAMRAAAAAEGAAAVESATNLASALERAASRALVHLDTLFGELTTFVAEHAGRTESALRLTDATRRQPGWATIEAAWEQVNASLVALRAGIDHLWEQILAGDAARDTGSGEHAEAHAPGPHETEALRATLIADLAAARRELAEIARGLMATIGRPAADDILWASRGPAQIGLHRAPLFVDEPLGRHLFAGKETLVLTSATLRAGDDFDYVRAQLGLPDATALALPSPFDYAQSTLLVLPSDMPAPEQPQHRKALNQALIALARALGGRTLALYTSYGALKESYHAIRKPLGDRGIVVLGQGMDGARHNLVRGLAEADLPTLLLGTSALWEGIDIPGPALSGLVITRLPFGVPSDPVFAARSEVFDDPFRDFAVPQAVLRFRQGFGRLIRSASDRGVVVVLDSRLRTKSYGWMFLDALPPCRRFEGPLAALADAAARWCAGDTTVGTAEPAAIRGGYHRSHGGDPDD